ncbi:hypothetical protein TEA_022029 [Camellia sinensis var. sinensis]|uniref:Uncharacterized protein n=1 Tax=Camellia sinensis var. sinensis TaxID=542762 RepID=A0A4S4DNA5_CAMSN|nr:hypothetical protein TEA_022029 [Camellia sinensis var. sinensis]
MMDKSWIDLPNRMSSEYINGIDEFLVFAYTNRVEGTSTTTLNASQSRRRCNGVCVSAKSTPHPSTIDQITQQVRAELRDELREELRAEFSTHLQQMRAEMMALVSQGASVDPNRQVPDASSGHRAFRESAEDENPYTPPPEDQV